MTENEQNIKKNISFYIQFKRTPNGESSWNMCIPNSEKEQLDLQKHLDLIIKYDTQLMQYKKMTDIPKQVPKPSQPNLGWEKPKYR
jgi:hypothetical protein